MHNTTIIIIQSREEKKIVNGSSQIVLFKIVRVLILYIIIYIYIYIYYIYYIYILYLYTDKPYLTGLKKTIFLISILFIYFLSYKPPIQIRKLYENITRWRCESYYNFLNTIFSFFYNVKSVPIINSRHSLIMIFLIACSVY
jgi:hypothetical protein